MLLDMALGSKAPASFQNRCRMTAALLLVVCVTLTKSAPTTYDEIEAKRTDLVDYFNDPNGCYYNYQHYEEGDRIVTNEPCLNCTCHNRMLMCYLRVCPFSKAIGQDCTVQKSPDQCCPVISCPEVPVHLLTSSTTQKPTTTTEIGWHDNYGCMMNENGFFPDGAQVPSDPKKPCELCYCIRNRTACVMQECTLHVEGCRPVYQEGVCCPVRYDCDYESEKSTTSAPQISGGLVFSTTSAPFDCRVNDEVYNDGESISMVSEKPCEHCYCMRGDIVCAVQDCGEPLRGKDCTPETPPVGQCCPTSYQCANETVNSDDITTLQPALQSDSDENEAEKFNSNNEIYNKLGENQPSQDNDIYNLDVDNVYTTAGYNDEIPSDGTSDQTTLNSVIENQKLASNPNTVPGSNNVNTINEEKQQENLNAIHDLTNQINPTSTETDHTIYESTNKLVELPSADKVQLIQSTADDYSVNTVSPTTQTTLDENTNVNINEENNNSENDSQPLSQDDLESNLPTVSTEISTETGTQSNNIQDKPQDKIEQQTMTSSKAEIEPTKSSNEVQNTQEEQIEIKPQNGITSNDTENPQKQNSEENTESSTVSDKIQTSIPLNEYEHTTQKLIQNDIEKPTLEESNLQTDLIPNKEQENSDQGIQDITQMTQQINSQTESSLNEGQNVLNDNKLQENVSLTDLPKVENEPTEQNKLPVENQPQVDDHPESENTSTEQNQDSAQSEIVSPTDLPKVENEPTEQNKLPAENQPQVDDQLESENTSTEQNQDSPQSENVSPTDLPKLENEPAEKNKLPVENQSQVDDHPESENTSTEQNQDSAQSEIVSPTDLPKVENEPTEQNKLPAENQPQVDDQLESENTSTEQNQDSAQSENVFPTELPKVENEPTEQNNLPLENESQINNQPESENTSTESNQYGPQSEYVSPTEAPKVENEPTEQNKLPVENQSQVDDQPESENTSTEQNQDSAQNENVSPTELPKVENKPTEQNDLPSDNKPQPNIQPELEETSTGHSQDSLQLDNVGSTELPKVENEPTVQNKLPVENQPQVDIQPESESTSTVSNQDGPQSENVSPTELPKVENEPAEQNNLPVENQSQVDDQPESENTSTEQNQDSAQNENVSPTELPKVENKPTEQNDLPSDNKPQPNIQPESEETSTGQNQDSLQLDNVSPTELPKVESEPTEQYKPQLENNPQIDNQPESENPSTEQNQDSPQSESVSPTELPKVENEPTEQTKLPFENQPHVDDQPDSENTSTEPNQDSAQSENVSPTDFPYVENEPTEQNNLPVENQPQVDIQPDSENTSTEPSQDSPQFENGSPSELPKVENESTEQNKLPVENQPQVDDQPESENTSTEQNQDSPQSENVSPTELPKVENKPTEQNDLPSDNKPQPNIQTESEETSTGQSQDSLQLDNVSPTELPKVENEPTEQNKPQLENNPQIENQPESENTPSIPNQDSLQSEDVTPTEFPKVDNEPTDQNKPQVENNPHTEDQPGSQKPSTEENQYSQEVINVLPTEIPSKPNESQSEHILSENVQKKPAVPENDLSTEQPDEDNNIFVVSPTSPPLFSQNQVKSQESTSTLNINDTNDTYSSTEKNENKVIEIPQTLAEDKISSTGESNKLPPLSSTETAQENNNVTPQVNDNNTEHSTEAKPIENEVKNDVFSGVTSSPVSFNNQKPVSDEHNDNRFGQNNQENSEPALAPTTETNDDVSSGLLNHGVLVDDSTSQDNQPDSVDEENQGVSDADLVEPQTGQQTVTPVELESSTNPSSVYETINDITTPLPQQQSADNIVPTKPEETNPVEPIEQTHDESIPIDLSENSSPESSDNHNVPTVIGEIHNVDEISKPTKIPVFDTNNSEQYITTQNPEENNEHEKPTPHEQSQDENINEIVEQSSINPEHLPGSNNNLNIATGSNLNNEEYTTLSSDKIEPDTSAQESGEEPTQNTNENVSVENESTTYSQAAQINQGSSEKVENLENLATTNSYADVSLVSTPINQDNENKEGSILNPSNNIEINVDNYQSATFIPQKNVDFDETSTQYSGDDSTTINTIEESPSMNVNNIPNGVNQVQITESELYATQSSTEKNAHTVDSNKIPITDATTADVPNLLEQNNSSEINANEIADEKPTETPYDSDNSLVTNTPDYVIDITTMSPPNNVPVSINTDDQLNSINEVTTYNIDQNNDVTTELYENVQPGVPGEGSCLINFITYAHKAEVPKSNPCHEKCECLNSIVTCTSVNCPPAPPTHKNCIPLHPGNESWCCPTYLCEGGIEGMIFENHDKLGGTPQLISSVLLEDKPGEENYDKTPSDEIQSTTSPQIALEYNTETPIQFDINSQDATGATEVPVQYEMPDKQVDDPVTTTDMPVTTASIESMDHKKPIGNVNPVISDQLTENIQSSENEKPVENDQSSENEKPFESNQSSENEKPTENYQSSENVKPEADITTVTYVSDVQTTTNKPEASNNFAEQTTLSNTVNESPDYSVISTDKPNYESTIANILPASDQIQPEHNSESDDSIIATTYAPKDSVVDQQENEQLKDGVNKPTLDEESNLKPISDITDLPMVEVTQTPTIVSDEKLTNNENNVNGLRPTSIDDIISSVNMVKDAIKNSLETSSKPAEIDYQTTVGVIENDKLTAVTGESGSPLLDESLLNKYNEPQTTVSSINLVPELPTDVSNEKLSENLTPIESFDELGGTTKSPNVLPSANQEISTDLSLNVPDKQEILSNPSASNSNVNKPEGVLDDKTPEVTTVQYVLSSTEQESASNAPESNDFNALQVNVESSTNVPGIVANDKISDLTTQQALQSEAQQEVHVDDLPINKPAEEETPANAESPVLPNTDANTDNVKPVEVVTQIVNDQLPTDNSAASNDSDDKNKYVGEPNSSPTPSEPSVVHEDNKRPQEGTGDMVQIPFDTEKPSLKPFSSTPFTPTYSHKPPYTPIPQSTWTPKPFHQDSTSEAPQPDQGFPDEYDDENEAVFGPGTCRYGGKIYVSAQQVPRDDPCDFCFCFRGDIICLQQSCPPPIFGCYQENIQGFCCPRYECPVAQTTSVNVTTTTTTTTTAVPPHFFAGAYRGAAKRTGCLIHGHAYKVGEDVGIASGPCLECTCRADGKMKCDPKPCSPEPLLRKMMAEAVDQRKR